MRKSRYSLFFLFAITLALAVFLSCSDGGDGSDDTYVSSGGGSGSSSSNGSIIIQDGDWPFDSSGESLQPTDELEAMDLDNVIKITYKNGDDPEIENDFTNEVTITSTGENIVVSIRNTSITEYNFVLSGTTANGSLKFYGDIEKTLYLNGVNIKNSAGPAINIQKSKKVIVHLVNGTQNFLEDGANYVITPNEQAKGAFFSEGKLEFEGSGSLTVKGNYNHAIAVDNDFEMNYGKIIVESVNDGIHVNDQVKVKGGVLQITSAGDAIQSEKIPPAGAQDWVKILGGKIKAQTGGAKSHGITSEGPIRIDSVALVQISVLGNGSKGIKSNDFVTFNGDQKTLIKTSGTVDSTNPDDESTPSGIKSTNLRIEGGALTIKSVGSKAKGISADVDIAINNGNVSIEADDDGIKVKGRLTINGGAVDVKSVNEKAVDGAYTKNGGNVTLNPVPEF